MEQAERLEIDATLARLSPRVIDDGFRAAR
jgi:hypothetical protein